MSQMPLGKMSIRGKEQREKKGMKRLCSVMINYEIDSNSKFDSFSSLTQKLILLQGKIYSVPNQLSGYCFRCLVCLFVCSLCV